MSIEMLRSLAGDTRGAFADWVRGLAADPVIAWYPSAGTDFRPLLYLHPAYASENPGAGAGQPEPDLYLFTDYFPWNGSGFLDGDMIHDDGRTRVTVLAKEELPGLGLGVDPAIATFPRGSSLTGRLFFLEVKVESARFGSFTRKVLYAFETNEEFCAKVLLPRRAKIDYAIHVRYGNGFGGGLCSGLWMLNVLRRLGCDSFLWDRRGDTRSGDLRAMLVRPALRGVPAMLELVRVIPGASWSNHGDVCWFRVTDRDAACFFDAMRTRARRFEVARVRRALDRGEGSAEAPRRGPIARVTLARRPRDARSLAEVRERERGPFIDGFEAAVREGRGS